MRIWLLGAALVTVSACAAGPGGNAARTDAAIPVYECDDTRIERSKHCRPRRTVESPAVLGQRVGTVAVPGPR